MTRERSVPDNPFPIEAVATTTIREVPDYRETAAFRESWTIIENFIEDFPAPQTRAHVALGLRGAYGSGKTHLLLQLLDSFTGGAPAFQLSPADSSGVRALAYYVKVDQLQLMDLYVNQLMRHIELDDFRTIIAGQLAKLLRSRGKTVQAQEPGGQSLVEIASREVDDQLATNPQLILSLLESDLLPVTGLAQSVRDDVRGSAADIGENFMRAYAYLIDPTLGHLALKWLKGQTLSAGEMKDLGLSVPAIDSQNHARTALRLLLTVLAKADVRLLVGVDEFERAALARGEAERIAAGAFIKDVVEIFIDAKQCAIFCGADDAWNAMKADVFDRIRDVVTVRMSSDEVLAILGVYCTASNLNRDVLFSRDARALLADIASRSPRRLLTLAHHTYNTMQRRGGRTATIEDVRDAANPALETNRRRGAVLQVVNAASRQRGWEVVADAPLGDAQVDLLLSKGDRRVAVHVLNSLFKLEELQDARAVAQHTRRAAKAGSRVAHVVVVTGYSSVEVRQTLNQLVDRVFWYEEGQFPETFAEFLDRPAASLDATVHVNSEAQQSAYQALEQRFTALESQRYVEVERLNALLASMQSEIRRTREAGRDTRAADKIERTLDALRTLLDREKTIVTSSSSESVLPLLDNQQALVRRLLLLNEPLPENELFAQTVMRLQATIEHATERNIGERQETVTDLETLHRARRELSMSLPRRWMHSVRRQWALSAAVALTAVGVSVFVTDMVRVRQEVAALTETVTKLQRAGEAVLLAFRPFGERYRLAMSDEEMTTATATFAAANSALGDFMDARPLVGGVVADGIEMAVNRDVLEGAPTSSNRYDRTAELADVIAYTRDSTEEILLFVQRARFAPASAFPSPVDDPGVYGKSALVLPRRLVSSCRAIRSTLATVDVSWVARRFYNIHSLLTMLIVSGWVGALTLPVVTRRYRDFVLRRKGIIGRPAG